jgi:hypothetical protein
MTVTNVELQSQIKSLDKKVDERHADNSKFLDDIAKKMDTLIELNLGQKLQAQLIEQLSARQKAHDDLFVEFFKRMAKVESTTGWHGMVWKAVGVVLLTSITGIGWLLVQMKDYYHLEYRVDTLEFLVQGRTAPVLPPAQTSSSK